MPKSQSSSLFLDVNVWVALSARGHQHFERTSRWLFLQPQASRLVFCRITQLSFLRLLTTKSVMEDETLTQSQAWKIYLAWRQDERVEFHEEPPGLDAEFFRGSQSNQARPHDWADHYLAAFAKAAGLTLVTHDKKLAAIAKDAILVAEIP